MQMGERLQNSHIVNINGMSAFAIERDCTGWQSIEDYMIQFVAESGGSDRVLRISKAGSRQWRQIRF